MLEMRQVQQCFFGRELEDSLPHSSGEESFSQSVPYDPTTKTEGNEEEEEEEEEDDE